MSSEWLEVSIGSCVKLSTGFPFKSCDYSEDPIDIKLLRGDNIAPGMLRWDGVKRWPKSKLGPELVNYELAAADILIAMDRPWIPAGLKFAKVRESDLPALLVQRVARLQPLNSIRSDFLYYVVGSQSFTDYIKNVTTGTAVPHISGQQIKNYKFKLPDISTQQKIGEILSSLDDRIALLRDTNVTLEAIAQALFKSWFVDFDPVRAKQQGQMPEGMDEATASLFPDSFEESELGLVPKGWQIGTIANVASYQNGYAFKTKDWQEAGHPVVKIGNVKPGIIDITGASCVSSKVAIGLDKFKLSRGDLLVGMTGYVGETGLVTEIQPPAYLNQRVGRIVTSAGINDLGFVYCVVRNPAYKTFAESKSHGSAQANVSGSDLMSFPVVLPANEILAAFNKLQATLIEGILANFERTQTLSNIRNTLLPRLISGQLRITEAEAAVEEVTA